MKKIFYILSIVVVTMGMYSCGGSKAVVVGEGENNSYSNGNRQELNEEMQEKTQQLKQGIQKNLKVQTVPAQKVAK